VNKFKCQVCKKEFEEYPYRASKRKYCSHKCYWATLRGQVSFNPKTGQAFGLEGTRFYRIWEGIKRRCQNPNQLNYSRYGARGINVCDKWQSFKGFYEDMYLSYKDELQIDRIDNDKGYFKENCRWVTLREQANNTNRNRYIEFKGIRDTVANWADYFGIKYGTFWRRIYMLGWPIEKALFMNNSKF